MAELFTKKNKNCTFECYSERGLLAYFMFRFLPQGKNLQNFLNGIVFPEKINNPFQHKDITDKVFFSELEFGKRDGFGCPDGAICFKINGNNNMLFIEGKFNETYGKSCKTKYETKHYYSTIRGQLELRWLCMSLYKNGKDLEEKGYKYIQGERDILRERPRKLKLIDGVKPIFDKYIHKCDENNIYFLCITKDEDNPFNKLDNKLNTYGMEWDNAKKRFCWCSVDYIVDLTKVE